MAINTKKQLLNIIKKYYHKNNNKYVVKFYTEQDEIQKGNVVILGHRVYPFITYEGIHQGYVINVFDTKTEKVTVDVEVIKNEKQLKNRIKDHIHKQLQLINNRESILSKLYLYKLAIEYGLTLDKKYHREMSEYLLPKTATDKEQIQKETKKINDYIDKIIKLTVS